MSYRPIHHITGKQGWINDPNGLVKFKGEYHVFFQHHPYSNCWGPMHWGHVVSKDLINFKYLPNALTPGDEFDKSGCFSGTAIVIDDTLYLAYTGFICILEDETKNRQITCLASSKDGINFTKHGAIIDTDQIPEGYLTTDFRDPKIFIKDNIYYIIVTAKKKTGGGSLLLFKSIDLFHWDLIGDILTRNSDGEMIECPEYVQDLDLLIFAEQNFPTENDHCNNVHSSEYIIGDFNKDFKFVERGEKTLVDYGFDFYAPQVIQDGHYLIGWLDMWGRNQPSAVDNFAGQLTIPRKLTVVDNILLQEPVIYGSLTRKINGNKHIEGNIEVGVLKLEIENLKELSFQLRVGEGEVTKFYLKDDYFYFDRSNSGIYLHGDEKDEMSLSSIRKMPYRKLKITEICMVFDKNSIEIFVNGISMSNLVYPKHESDKYILDLDCDSITLEEYK